jgi:hypothetical protein
VSIILKKKMAYAGSILDLINFSIYFLYLTVKSSITLKRAQTAKSGFLEYRIRKYTEVLMKLKAFVRYIDEYSFFRQFYTGDIKVLIS